MAPSGLYARLCHAFLVKIYVLYLHVNKNKNMTTH